MSGPRTSGGDFEHMVDELFEVDEAEDNSASENQDENKEEENE